MLKTQYGYLGPLSVPIAWARSSFLWVTISALTDETTVRTHWLLDFRHSSLFLVPNRRGISYVCQAHKTKWSLGRTSTKEWFQLWCVHKEMHSSFMVRHAYNLRTHSVLRAGNKVPWATWWIQGLTIDPATDKQANKPRPNTIYLLRRSQSPQSCLLLQQILTHGANAFIMVSVVL